MCSKVVLSTLFMQGDECSNFNVSMRVYIQVSNTTTSSSSLKSQARVPIFSISQVILTSPSSFVNYFFINLRIMLELKNIAAIWKLILSEGGRRWFLHLIFVGVYYLSMECSIINLCTISNFVFVIHLPRSHLFLLVRGTVVFVSFFI